MLEVSDIRAGYGTVDVLHGVSLRVPRGGAVAVLGANGAGKTTLFRAIAGLLPVRAGSLTFDRVAVAGVHASRRARSGLCLIPEGRGIFRHLSVLENVAMFVAGRKVPGAFDIAAEAFPRLGERRHQMAGTLSGGEQQMLAVTRALVTDPSLVMFDELSMGLAPLVIDEIYAAVKILHQQGKSLLLVDQYVDRVLPLADSVYFLKKGRITHVGPAAEYRDEALLAALHLGGAGAEAAR